MDQETKEELKNYVRREEFSVVRSVVYGLASTVLIAVLMAVLQLVIK